VRLHILWSKFEDSASFVPVVLGVKLGGVLDVLVDKECPREPLGVEKVGSSCDLGHKAGVSQDLSPATIYASKVTG
jgi:hypothetical protein